MKNILLVGHFASGKTTIAAALGEAGYQLQSFSGGIKDILVPAYGPLSKGKAYSTHDVHQGTVDLSGRELMQKFGQSIKLIDEFFWLRVVERKMKQAEFVSGHFEKWVIDDGRFDFELSWARDKGWLIVGVNTSEPIRMQRYKTVYGREPTKAEMEHPSEQQIPQLLLECDVVVQGSDDAYWNAKKILENAR
jgi:dephospho-CoA kinase